MSVVPAPPEIRERLLPDKAHHQPGQQQKADQVPAGPPGVANQAAPRRLFEPAGVVLSWELLQPGEATEQLIEQVGVFGVMQNQQADADAGKSDEDPAQRLRAAERVGRRALINLIHGLQNAAGV